MKKILVLIKHTTRFITGYLLFLLTNKRNEFGYQSLIKLFTETQGKSTKLIHYVISKVKSKYQVNYPVESQLGKFSYEDISHIVKEIETNGFYVFPNRLSEETCNSLMKFAMETEALVRPIENDDNTVKGWTNRQKTKIDREKPLAIRYDFLVKDLLENSEIQDLLADLSLIAIAQEYLNCKPKSDVLGMWWHTSYFKEENPDAATMYHFDMDRVKWLKFFFYLTDTKKENGAHQFISGSHNGNIPKQFMKRGYSRLSEKEVEDYYGKERVITYEAPRGTIIAEDTSGLHRGYPVQKGDRLLFQIQYSDSLFGAELHNTVVNKETLSSNLRDMISKYPEIYEYYLKDLN